MAPETEFTLSPILEPLEPFKNDIVILRGMNFESSHEQVRADRQRARPGHDRTC